MSIPYDELFRPESCWSLGQPKADPIDSLRKEVRELRDIISELVLRIDLKELGVDPGEVFLPGLKIGRKQK